MPHLLHLMLLLLLHNFLCRGVSSAAAALGNEVLVKAEQETLLLTLARTGTGSRRNCEANIDSLKGIADVGVLIFHGDPTRTWEMWKNVRKKATAAKVVFRIGAPGTPPNPRPHPPSFAALSIKQLNTTTFVPKLYFQLQALDWIELYEVFLHCVVALLHCALLHCCIGESGVQLFLKVLYSPI